jgi:hypothetical protein
VQRAKAARRLASSHDENGGANAESQSDYDGDGDNCGLAVGAEGVRREGEGKV